MTSNSLVVSSPSLPSEPETLEDLFKAYLRYLVMLQKAGEITDKTSETYAWGTKKFIYWLDAHRGEVSNEVIREWIADLRAKNMRPNTINTWLSGVRHFFAWCLRNRKIQYDPTVGVRGAKKSGIAQMHLREALTDDEVVRVFDSIETADLIGKRDKAMIALMAFCGARESDVHRADIEQLKTEKGKLVLHVMGKGRVDYDEVLVIANPEADGYLRDYVSSRGNSKGALFQSYSPRSRGERIALSSIRAIVKGYYRKAGVVGDKKSTHSLRHAAAVNALSHGAPITKIQSMLRHINIATTMIYAKEVSRIEEPGEEFINYRTQSKTGKE